MRAPRSVLLALAAAGLAALAGTGGAATAATTPADDTGAVDFGPVREMVAARLATETGPDRAVYARLARTFDERRPGGLVRDLRKLVAAVGTLRRLRRPDTDLAALVRAAAAAAEETVGRRPDAVEARVDRILPDRPFRKVESLALAGFRRYRTVQSDATNDLARRLRGVLGAARTYQAALREAHRVVVRQGGPAATSFAAEPGRVYTVLGTGEGGFNGDGRAARRTSLYFVEEVRFGPDGLLYVLDWNNHMLRCLDPDGTVRRICGAGTPGDSEGAPEETQLNHPSSMAFAPDGRIFIAAWHNHKVKVYDPDAAGGPTVYTIAGGPAGTGGDGGLATQARFNLLPGIARYPNGDLLVCDAANQVVRKILLSAPQEDVNVAGVTVDTGVVVPFAGTTGVEGYAGDGGPASDAELTFNRAQNAEPDGRMEIDALGRVYVVCGKGNVIRRIETDGTITTFAGTGEPGYSGDGGAAKDARLDGPTDIALAPDGSVFVSDSNNHVVRRVDPSGTITTFAGAEGGGFGGDGGPALAARFSRPSGLELDAHGNLYVCDRYNNRVRVIASATDPGGLTIPIEPYRLPLPSRGGPPAKGPPGTIDTYAGVPLELGFNGDRRPALDTELYWPQDVGVDPQLGLVWFLDWNNHRVRRVEADGTVSTVVGSGELGDSTGPAPSVRMNHPTDLAFHPVTGELWIAAWHTDKILRLRSDTNEIVYAAGGARGFQGDGGPAIGASLNIPTCVKFDSAGNWYVCDEGNRRIRFVDGETGIISTLCGTGETDPLGDGGPALQASLNFPIGQAAQPAGRLCLSPDEKSVYVADSNHHRIRRIALDDPEHRITTVAGNGQAGYTGDGGLATDARLRVPTDVDCDAYGNLYIADGDNNAIRRVDVATGILTTVAGTGEAGFSGDGGPANAARLNAPSGLFVDRATGRIYVADTYNGVLRVIWE